MIRLRNLVESLEAKYNLNEAFSEDMPDWFAKRVLTTKYTPTSWYNARDLGGAAHYPNGSSYAYMNNKANKKNPQSGQTPEYRHSDSWYGDQSLFSKLLAAGISLDTVKIIEGPIPTSENDKRLQPPNIPIFLFDNGVVYAKGLNDDEKLGTRKSLGTYTIDKLLQQCKKFAYIDGNDPNNFTVKDKRLARTLGRNKYINRQNKYFDRDRKDLFTSPNWNPNMDKSGYEVIPPAEKYEDKLNEIKAGKVYDILKGYEDYINNCYQELGNLISQTQIVSHDNTNKPDYDPYTMYTNNDHIANMLETIASLYSDVVQEVDKILSSGGSDAEKKQGIVALIKNKFPRIDRAVDRLEQTTNKVFNSTIDWI